MTTNTATQEGTYDVSGVTWTEGLMTLEPSLFEGGLYYTLQTETTLNTGIGAGTRSLAVDPNRWRSLVLTLTPASTLSGTLTISARIDGANSPSDLIPAAFANANQPTDGDLITVYSADPGFTASTATTITVDLSAANSGGPSATDAQVSAYLHSSHQGRLALALTWTGTSITMSTTTPMVSDDQPFLSGVEKWPQVWARVDRCPKCGFIITRDQLVRDGYTEAMVCSKCWDPEDTVGRANLGRERTDPFDRN